jgi:hypothetical protein
MACGPGRMKEEILTKRVHDVGAAPAPMTYTVGQKLKRAQFAPHFVVFLLFLSSVANILAQCDEKAFV